jgi:hypothetical protein
MRLFEHLNHAWIDGYPEKNDEDEGIFSASILLKARRICDASQPFFADAIFVCPSTT